MSLTPNQIREQVVSERRLVEIGIVEKVIRLPENVLDELIFWPLEKVKKMMKVSQLEAFYLRRGARRRRYSIWLEEEAEIETDETKR